MKSESNQSLSHAVFSIKLHIVFVTKYRRQMLSTPMLEHLREAFSEILGHWRCELIEFGGEADHVHLLVGIHPALNVSVLINNLKTASARRCGNRFRSHIDTFYKKRAFWHRAYFVGSVGDASLEVVQRYVKNQGTSDKPGRRRKA